MARNGRTAPVGNGATPPGASGAPDALGVPGVDAARGLIGAALASLARVIDGFEQMQALNASMLAGWRQTLALSSRDLDQAKDLEQVMALPAQMLNRQLEQTSQRWAEAVQDLFDAQAQWADQWRRQMADQLQQATASATQPAGQRGGVQPASLAAIGPLPAAWLALTREWIDAIGTSAPAPQPARTGTEAGALTASGGASDRGAMSAA